MKTLWSLLVAALVGSVSTAAHAEGTGIRRFALVAGANNGGSDRVTLRYATSDAQSVAKVLRELGGVSKDDLLLLSEPNLTTFKDAFGTMKKMISGAKGKSARTELFVYYSGHSDEDGLLLNGSLFKYGELRTLIQSAGADVGVAILDSCASGALTLQKGGEKKPPFLRDLSAEVKGHAFLTSSSADEVAQESERIGASFFTYFLVSGLRGAADSTRDGKVTLHEAYQFAFAETLARTENTKSGPQHPAYDIQLTGTGDLVMTDLRETSASLLFDTGLSGRLYVRDESDRLLCELKKETGRTEVLALAPGKYRVNLEADGKLYQATTDLSSGKKQTLAKTSFAEVAKEKTVARGDGAPIEGAQEMPLDEMKQAAPSADPATPEEEAGDALSPQKEEPAPTKRKLFRPDLYSRISPLSLGFTDQHENFNGVGFGFFASSMDKNMRGFQLSTGLAAVRGTLTGAQVSVIAGYAGEVRGLQVSGVSMAGDQMAGLQVGSVGATVDGNLAGLQASGVLNVVEGSSTGFQVSGLFNWTYKDFNGLQASIANITGGNFRGLQIAGSTNSATDVIGLQAAGGVNIARGNVFGMQVAGIANVNKDFGSGLQAAGVVNWGGEDFGGLQVSGLTNVSERMYGAQIGVINIARDISGAQVGVINIANHVYGTQVGVVNLSRDLDGMPVGLFSYAKNGVHSVDLWASDVAPLNAGLKLGTKRAYTLFYGGLVPTAQPEPIFGMGLGLHKTRGALGMSFDVLSSSSPLPASVLPDLMNSARFLLSLHPVKSWPNVSVMAGPTMNAFINFAGKPPASRELFPQYVVRGDFTSVVFSPGFTFGVSL